MSITTEHIRPSARIISTIGEELIGDPYAAIIELVKNSYDADATEVMIELDWNLDEKILNIEISDNGHGMSRDIVINKWLVPATPDKLIRKKSNQYNRDLQGRKGIGRFAAAILGQEMVISTIDETYTKTEILIDWGVFSDDKFLSDIEVLVDSQNSPNLKQGTTLSIIAKEEKFDSWKKEEIDKLILELNKLSDPTEKNTTGGFHIFISMNNPPEGVKEGLIEIKPFPIEDFFDYRISGKVDSGFNFLGKYENNVTRVVQSEIIQDKLDLGENFPNCGEVELDFRVFDLDPPGISNLLNKGLIDPVTDHFFGKREAKGLIKERSGVSIYRNNFWIRPYGETGIDWLKLDNKRIQNPSKKVGNDQIIGLIRIQGEESSNLLEKSARDGLKENLQFKTLKKIAELVLDILETRRHSFRNKSRGIGKASNLTSEIDKAFDLSTLEDKIKKRLSNEKIPEEALAEISDAIRDEEKKKNNLVESLKNTIAIYEGQATLGKVAIVILHEGRKPLSVFRTQSENLSKIIPNLLTIPQKESPHGKIIGDIIIQFQKNSEILAQLFKRLDPLARQNRGRRKNFSLYDAIQNAAKVFEKEISDNKIQLTIEGEKSLTIWGWEEDIIFAFTNLLENSIYWLNQSAIEPKTISISISKSDDTISIRYRNNGPPIPIDRIESGDIFTPGFTLKLEGTGLGLPIAGEAISRLGGEIMAIYVPDGAFFSIEINQKNENDDTQD